MMALTMNEGSDDAQADLSLQWSQMLEDIFSHGETEFILNAL